MNARDRLRGAMTVEELRARIFSGKEETRVALAGRPVMEKLRSMETMRQAAAPIRAARGRIAA